MSIQSLPVILKIKIIEYLCDSEYWINLKMFVSDVFNWLKAEPGLYVELQKHKNFKDDIWVMARLKYMDEWLENMEDEMSEYVIDTSWIQNGEEGNCLFLMDSEEES
jgi:hypothetical protein